MLRGPRPENGRPLKILLVEDNLDHVVITRQAVTSILPCEVEVVNDGVKAVEKLAALATGSVPDLVLLDLHLPGMNGVEVLRWMRADPASSATAPTACAGRTMTCGIRSSRRFVLPVRRRGRSTSPA